MIKMWSLNTKYTEFWRLCTVGKRNSRLIRTFLNERYIVVDYCQTIESKIPKRQKKLNPFVCSPVLYWLYLSITFCTGPIATYTSDALFTQKRVLNIQYSVHDVTLPKAQLPGRPSTALLKTESVSQFHMNLLL